MLPNAQDKPATSSQLSRYLPVTRFVARHFFEPISLVGSRLAPVPWAAVPEATVHEQGNARVSKNKVGAACDWQMPSPAFNSGLAENGSQANLSVLVPFGFDSRHHFRTLALAENIGHRAMLAASRNSASLQGREHSVHYPARVAKFLDRGNSKKIPSERQSV